MTTCTFYIRANDNPPNQDELKSKLGTGSAEQRALAVKELIRCIVNDQSYPPMIMNVITNIVPMQHQSPSLRKVMLLYWEVIEKSKSPTDKSLKQEVFLACNSLRNDLIGFNEFVRGRVLRLMSHIMHRGMIEPLASAISKNLEHKSAYVRRNCVICLYKIYLSFGSDIVGDIDDEIEELLKTETDLSTKRNAFLLLNKSNPGKAMAYIETQIKNQSVEQIGDILQLAILETLRVRCKDDPGQKPRLLKIVKDFLNNTADSVRLECAITSTAISNSASTIKSSLSIYVSILAKTSEINVKKIILDKLQIICRNSNYLEDDLTEDLVKSLNTPSAELKTKVIEIIMACTTPKSATIMLHYFEREGILETDPDYLTKVLSFLQIVTFKFTQLHAHLAEFFCSKLLRLKETTKAGLMSLTNIMRLILQQNNGNSPSKGPNFAKRLVKSFRIIESCDLFKSVLNILGSWLRDEEEIRMTIDEIKVIIGELPIRPQSEKTEAKEEEEKLQRKMFKTVILEDGSYSSELVVVQSAKEIKEAEQDSKGKFRHFLVSSSIFGGVFTRNVLKLLYKLRRNKHFNKQACSVLMILCSLLRHYQSIISAVDQAVIDQITMVIRQIVNPDQFLSQANELLEARDNTSLQFTFKEKKAEMIEKNPEDIIHFRLLRKSEQAEWMTADDEEVNDIMEEGSEQVGCLTKLKSIKQLTGNSDPIYAEAFVHPKKSDIFVQILLINQLQRNLLNVQIEFSSDTTFVVLQKAQCVNLRPHESVLLRSQTRFTGSQFGTLYGYINYDNQSGIQQPYLVTDLITIDYINFVRPATISPTNFKLGWPKAGQISILELFSLQQSPRAFRSIVKHFEKELHLKLVEEVPDDYKEDYFLNCHLFGKSALGEDVFVSMSLFAGEMTTITFHVRSKDKALINIMHSQIKQTFATNYLPKEDS